VVVGFAVVFAVVVVVFEVVFAVVVVVFEVVFAVVVVVFEVVFAVVVVVFQVDEDVVEDLLQDEAVDTDLVEDSVTGELEIVELVVVAEPGRELIEVEVVTGRVLTEDDVVVVAVELNDVEDVEDVGVGRGLVDEEVEFSVPSHEVIKSSSSVMAAWARRSPCTVAPVVTVMDVPARMDPTNVEPVPSVAAEVTTQ